jgi:hypothetical protein
MPGSSLPDERLVNQCSKLGSLSRETWKHNSGTVGNDEDLDQRNLVAAPMAGSRPPQAKLKVANDALSFAANRNPASRDSDSRIHPVLLSVGSRSEIDWLNINPESLTVIDAR